MHKNSDKHTIATTIGKHAFYGYQIFALDYALVEAQQLRIPNYCNVHVSS